MVEPPPVEAPPAECDRDARIDPALWRATIRRPRQPTAPAAPPPAPIASATPAKLHPDQQAFLGAMDPVQAAAWAELSPAKREQILGRLRDPDDVISRGAAIAEWGGILALKSGPPRPPADASIRVLLEALPGHHGPQLMGELPAKILGLTGDLGDGSYAILRRECEQVMLRKRSVDSLAVPLEQLQARGGLDRHGKPILNLAAYLRRSRTNWDAEKGSTASAEKRAGGHPMPLPPQLAT